MTHDRLTFLGAVAFAIVFVLMAGALPYYAGTDADAKWTTCVAKCAPMAPAEYERACYCDARTTLPPTPNED